MDQLRVWFENEKRSLPWRDEPKTPYRIWISEVMLQQTQVLVVVPYFKRWMDRFPTVWDLAKAPLEEVIKMWEGLGYYSRARNLYKAAQRIVSEYNGLLPSEPEQLRQLPGFGSYTVGAVLSFAFHQRAAAVDGNVMRVLSRMFTSESTKKLDYEKLLLSILPEKEPWIWVEALIELGALICQKIPKCSRCPLQMSCRAHLESKERCFPIERPRESVIRLKREVAIVLWGIDEVMISQVQGNGVMAGLYEFPYFPLGEALPIDLPLKRLKTLPMVSHSFTRYRVTLFPIIYKSFTKCEIEPFQWRKISELSNLPFSAGHRRILEALRVENFTH